MAHERAVFKAIAIVADTKKIVQELDIDSLAELRSTQKAALEVEDLMAAVIMICMYIIYFLLVYRNRRSSIFPDIHFFSYFCSLPKKVTKLKM